MNGLIFFNVVSSLFVTKEKLPVLEIHSKQSKESLMVDCYNYIQKLNIITNLKGLRISARQKTCKIAQTNNVPFEKHFPKQLPRSIKLPLAFVYIATNEYLRCSSN